ICCLVKNNLQKGCYTTDYITYSLKELYSFRDIYCTGITSQKINEDDMKKKELVKVSVDLLLMICVVLFLLSAINMIFATSGKVYGTEFGMLITLVSTSNKILALLCLCAFRYWLFSDTSGLNGVMDFLKSIQKRVDAKNP
ncbi:MAG: hypothetical protein WCH10_06975, partial [bacterium]